MKESIVKSSVEIRVEVVLAARIAYNEKPEWDWGDTRVLGEQWGISLYDAHWAFIAAEAMNQPPYVSVEDKERLVIVPDPVDDRTRVVVVNWATIDHEGLCFISGTDRCGIRKNIILPIGTLLYEGDTLIGNLYLLPSYVKRVPYTKRPFDAIGPWDEFARERRAYRVRTRL